MHSGRMFAFGYALRKRQDTRFDDLPSSITPPTETLPATIVPSDVVTDPTAIASVVSAEAPSGLTTIIETQTLALTGPVPSTVTSVRTRTITDALEYASITSAAADSSSSTTEPTSSRASSTSRATAGATTDAPSSNLSTLIPAIVVPIVVVLLASLALFWFILRRRHRRELSDQPEFVMAGKGEKLSSRSNSARSVNSELRPMEKKSSPIVAQKELPSTSAWRSPAAKSTEWPTAEIGLARPLTPQDPRTGSYTRPFDQSPVAAPSPARSYRNFSGPSPSPHTTTPGRSHPPPVALNGGAGRSRGNSITNQRPPPSSRSGPSPTSRSGMSPTNLTGPSPTRTMPTGLPGSAIAPSTAFRLRDPSPSMNQNNRAQAPSRLEAPGAYNGASSISQYSPIVKDAPASALSGPSNKRQPPPPLTTMNLNKSLKTPSSASPGGMTEENLRIARLATSSRLGHSPAEPSPSPKLPPPATRSQLIPRDGSRYVLDDYYTTPDASSASHRQGASKRSSIISDADEYEDIDAKSDISSLNEFERFDFGEGAGSRSGSAAGTSLNYFAAQNSPASGRGSPFGTVLPHERW
ncbi:hypothetical protein B0A52_07201 [Exophiala mesophila]|uniref:Uncharacterized protein n=1 Tax=Exophiala mesophila TaxID=212818 RepID=A0A438N0H8_EXOME|nr:hypothetical protein B0A52_07201 [Exophiala mesophila]